MKYTETHSPQKGKKAEPSIGSSPMRLKTTKITKLAENFKVVINAAIGLQCLWVMVFGFNLGWRFGVVLVVLGKRTIDQRGGN
jgi:hypothetical protein